MLKHQVTSIKEFKKQKEENVCHALCETCPEKIKSEAYQGALIAVAKILTVLPESILR